MIARRSPTRCAARSPKSCFTSLRSLWSRDQLAIVEAAVERAGGADLATRTRITALLAQSLGHAGQTDRRLAAAGEALELARSSLDPTLLVRVAPDLLYALWTPGAAAARALLAAEVTALADEGNDLHLVFLVHHASFGAAICVGIAWSSWGIFQRDFEHREFIGVIGVMTMPTSPFRALIFLGAAVAAVQFLLMAVSRIRRADTGGIGQ